MALAAVLTAFVGLFSYACPRRGEQSFSVEVRVTGPSGADAEGGLRLSSPLRNALLSRNRGAPYLF